MTFIGFKLAGSMCIGIVYWVTQTSLEPLFLHPLTQKLALEDRLNWTRKTSLRASGGTGQLHPSIPLCGLQLRLIKKGDQGKRASLLAFQGPVTSHLLPCTQHWLASILLLDFFFLRAVPTLPLPACLEPRR